MGKPLNLLNREISSKSEQNTRYTNGKITFCVKSSFSEQGKLPDLYLKIAECKITGRTKK